MKRPLRFYFETSVFSRLVADPEGRRTLTYRLLTRVRRKHLILVSQEVAAELHRIPDLRLRRLAEQKFRRVDPKMIPYRARVDEIAYALLARAGWGPRRLADVTHIGYAMVGRADGLVTWDLGDLAREHTRRLVAAEARSRGIPAPDIVTPREALEEWLGVKIL